jgi:RING-like zinc finger
METVKDMTTYSKGSLWVAWVSSFFAAGSGTVLLLVLLFDVRETLYRRHHGLNGDFDNGGDGDDEKRGYLTSTQARHICVTYSSVLNADSKELSEWVCSICLEDNEPDTEIRTILLPCSHRFHRQYVCEANCVSDIEV